MPQPSKSPTTSGANLWLAIGDETGSFEHPQLSTLHGAGLILARPAALAAALNENLNGRSIRQRMDSPIEGLENWLREQGAKKEDEPHRHHVREAWLYLIERRIKGQYPLDATHSDPVLNNLLAAFRWLAGHPDIISLGIYGTTKEVMTDFWKGSDSMAVLGAIYGRSLALIKPFLGPSPRIRVLPGRPLLPLFYPFESRHSRSRGRRRIQGSITGRRATDSGVRFRVW